MTSPVPPGRWHEYAAAISEGFCPACRHPFTHIPEGRSEPDHALTVCCR